MQEFLDALRAGDTAAASRLLDAHPALLQSRTAAAASWLATAIYHGQAGIARLFLERGVVPDLFEAAMLGDVGRVRQCIEVEGADVDGLSPDGFPALSLAVFFGHPETFRYLLERGANVHQPAANAMGVAPIHAAAARRDAESVQALLARGADPNARQAQDFTALHTAAANGDERLAGILLAAGADRHARSAQNQTPADLAAEKGHTALAERLR